MTSSVAHFTDAGCRGLLTDLLRFSLHDGPGIRTTVFFKGCPLCCPWCHNPETQSPDPELEFRAENCVRCGSCVRACGGEDGGTGFSREKCRDLDAAAAACVHDALRLTGRWWTVAEVMAEVMKDAAYYAASAGGLTLSGGEPLLQPEFASELLTAARKHSLHTCVETSGYVDHARFQQMLPFIDLLLFDWKMSDSDTHRRLTGVPNALIRTNLTAAVRDLPVILRCPLVPGVNDTAEHLTGIVELARRHPIKKIEIMPYHDGGAAKYPHYGRTYGLPETRVKDEDRERWLRILATAPCPVIYESL